MSTATVVLACQTKLSLRGVPCGQAAEMVTVGCMHEHVREVTVCPPHQEEIRRLEHFCTPCLEHETAAHECRLYLLRQPGQPL